MRFQISHRTTYSYSSDVSISHHVAHLTPRQTPSQRTLFHEIAIEPVAIIDSRRQDYFGNDLTAFAVNGVHRSLEIIASSQVELIPGPPPVNGLAWEAARSSLSISTDLDAIDAQQYVYPSPFAPKLPALVEYGQESFQPGRSYLEAVTDLSSRIHRDFKFDTRATTIATLSNRFSKIAAASVKTLPTCKLPASAPSACPPVTSAAISKLCRLREQKNWSEPTPRTPGFRFSFRPTDGSPSIPPIISSRQTAISSWLGAGILTMSAPFAVS